MAYRGDFMFMLYRKHGTNTEEKKVVKVFSFSSPPPSQYP